MKKIKVKYFTDFTEEQKIIKIKKGDWIDLRCACDIDLIKGVYYEIPLGVGIKMPKNYEAIVAPRSSLYKKYGIISANSLGVIDNSYCGDNDQWHFLCIATKNTTVHKGDRICQFRIQKSMGDIKIKEVKKLKNKNRGGIGSTGVK